MKNSKKLYVIIFLFILCIGIGCIIINTSSNFEATSRFIKWTKRKVAIKIMQTFDIQDAYRTRCLVKNKFIKISKNMEDICNMCENMDHIHEYQNYSGQEDVIEAVTRDIHNDHPVVVRGSDNQSDVINVPVTELADHLGTIPSLLEYEQCQYQSNLKARHTELPHLMNYIATDRHTPFYTFWENCASPAVKEFRIFYERPSCIGGHVQLTGTNWMYLCRNYTGKLYRKIELYSPFVLIIVKTGDFVVRLEAAADCAGTCDNLDIRLHNGDTLMFNANVYSLLYKPICEGHESIVIGVSGYTD